MNLKLSSKLSVYQDPEGTLKEKDKWEARTGFREKMPFWNKIVRGNMTGRSVLDLGCNNGYFTRWAADNGAVRAVGVDYSDCIIGAREYAKGTHAEFWQMDLESKEFQRFCPKFDVVFLFSVLTHLKDKEKFLDWLDDKVRGILVFESNHGESNKKHIDLVSKHIYFESVEYIGVSDIPRKPHHIWVCRRPTHELRYPVLKDIPVEFLPIECIKGIDEKIILNQRRSYPVTSEKFLELKEDIKNRGIRDPLVIKEKKKDVYYMFQGGHRYLAAKELGYKSVPCKVIRKKHVL